MRVPFALTALVLAAGCPPEVDDTDTDVEDTDPDTDVAPGQTHAIVATTDFAVGALATVDLGDLSVDDTLATVGGDPLVVVDDGAILQLNRGATDSLRFYTLGEWNDPVEVALPAGGNAHDAEICGGKVFVSLFGTDGVAAYDLDGTHLGTVSLAAYADADGSGEPDLLVEAGGKLYVGLNRLDTSGQFWTPAGDGHVVELDCDTMNVLRSWEVGENTTIYAHPSDDTRLLVRTGTYYSIDGGLSVLDTATGALTSLVTEAELGLDIGDLAASATHAVLLTSATDFSGNHVRCLDFAADEIVEGPALGNYLADVAIDDRGRAFVAVNTDYADAEAPTGVMVLDVETCAATGELLETTLPPYSIAVY